MDVDIKKIESNRGKPVIIVDGHKFRQSFVKKTGMYISFISNVKAFIKKRGGGSLFSLIM